MASGREKPKGKNLQDCQSDLFVLVPGRILPGECFVQPHHLMCGNTETVGHEVPDRGILCELRRVVGEAFRQDIARLCIDRHSRNERNGCSSYEWAKVTDQLACLSTRHDRQIHAQSQYFQTLLSGKRSALIVEIRPSCL